MIRVLLYAILFRRMRRDNPELFDGKKAIAAVLAAIKEDGYETV